MKVSPQADGEADSSHKQNKGGEIHPTAIIDPEAVLGSNVSVGAYSVIGAGVTIGDDNVIMNHVTIHGITRIGRGNRFYPNCVVGMDPQDKKYEFNQPSELEIGDENVFRESVTLNRGTPNERGITRVGSRNWLLAYCHIAHDCVVGDETVFAQASAVGGCVTVGDYVYIGGYSAVHPYCSLGEVAIVGGMTMIGQDVPPFVNVTGNRAKIYGLNKLGLKRSGFSKEEISELDKAYKIYYRGKLSSKEALARLDSEFPESTAVKKFSDFIKQSTRGVYR